jgi:GNAT superfamily N-acetyltransferase
MTTAPELSVRPAAPADLPAILDLMTASLAGGPTGQRSADAYRWKHVDNPFGESIALVAEVEGRIVGLRTMMRWRFVRDGVPFAAIRAVDTATHPDFQGRGIFRRLTEHALDLAREDTAFVFNTPNDNSRPGYLKMGWEVVGQVPIAIRVVRPTRFARGIRGVGAATAGAQPPPCSLPPAESALDDVDGVRRLLQRWRPPTGALVTDRSPEYLRWRYLGNRDLGYRAIALRRDSELVGLAIGRPRWRGSLAELTLAEAIVADRDLAVARRLLRAAARSGVDHVATHLVGAPAAAAVRRRLGYVDAPGQGMLLTRRTLADDRTGRQMEDWALTLGDLEVF